MTPTTEPTTPKTVIGKKKRSETKPTDDKKDRGKKKEDKKNTNTDNKTNATRKTVIHDKNNKRGLKEAKGQPAKKGVVKATKTRSSRKLRS